MQTDLNTNILWKKKSHKSRVFIHVMFPWGITLHSNQVHAKMMVIVSFRLITSVIIIRYAQKFLKAESRDVTPGFILTHVHKIFTIIL